MNHMRSENYAGGQGIKGSGAQAEHLDPRPGELMVTHSSTRLSRVLHKARATAAKAHQP